MVPYRRSVEQPLLPYETADCSSWLQRTGYRQFAQGVGRRYSNALKIMRIFLMFVETLQQF